MRIYHYKILSLFCLISFATLFSSCANQEPPPGGPEDKTPPVIINLSPRDSTTNFSGNKLSFEFDEYVNRRSFEEAFFISPAPSSAPKFDWTGKSVDVIFDKGFDINKTYSVTINRDFKDLNGNNTLTAPFNFAFTTGNKIENASISGSLFGDDLSRIIVSCYLLPNAEPDKKKGDYITQPDLNGNYTFRNLSPGTYRVFVIRDESRDQLFNKEIDKIAIPYKDAVLERDSAVMNLNFLLSSPILDTRAQTLYNGLTRDTTGSIYSSIKPGDLVPEELNVYFYLKNKKITKSDFADKLTLKESFSGKNVKIAFNWINDSLVNIFSAEKLELRKDYEFNAPGVGTGDNRINYKLNFRTVAEKDVSNVMLKINLPKEEVPSENPSGKNIIFVLINASNIFVRYGGTISDSGSVQIKNVPLGDYKVFAYEDANDNGNYDYGTLSPFEYAERFYYSKGPVRITRGVGDFVVEVGM